MRVFQEMGVSLIFDIILSSSNMVQSTFAVVLASALLTIVAGEDLYPDKYDNIDVHAIITNDQLRNQYYYCFMGTGPCVTEDAVFFQEHFTEAVVTKCRRCTQKQKDNFEILVAWYTENRLAEWEALMAKTLENAKKLNISP